MRKIIKFLLIIAIMISACLGMVACKPAGGNGADTGVIYKRYKGEDFYTVYDYVDDSKVTELNIPSEIDGVEVRRINAGAFDGSSLKSIVVPNTVTEIGKGAFKNMKKLASLTLPFVGKNANSDAFFNETASSSDKAVDSERTISYLFGEEEYDLGLRITNNYNSTSSTTCYIPQTLTKIEINSKDAYSIPMYAFNGVVNLRTVVLGDKIDAIGESAFYGCIGLKTIKLPATVKSIYKSAFEGCTILDVEEMFPAQSVLTTIGARAFALTKFSQITIPALVTTIGDSCFKDSEIQTIKLSQKLSVIEKEAFYNCAYLTSVDVSALEGKVALGVFAFADCKKLTMNSDTLAKFTYTADCFMDSGVTLA